MAELAAGGGLEPDEQAAVAQLVSLAWTDRQDKLLLRDARQAAVQDDVHHGKPRVKDRTKEAGAKPHAPKTSVRKAASAKKTTSIKKKNPKVSEGTAVVFDGTKFDTVAGFALRKLKRSN